MDITLTKELLDHVNSICAESKAWAEAAPKGEFRGYSDYDESDILFHCEHYTKGERSLTPDEWDQTKAWEEYYDAYKSANGIRPRWTNWQDKSADEWERLTTEAYELAADNYEVEEKEETYIFESPAELQNNLEIHI
jgi:hypothetical protein